jgi:drug/metabolite transporter (DMT)-like permease
VPARAITGRSRPLNPTAIALILVAAIAHASWNLFSKQASVTGAVSFIWLMSAAGTALYAPVIVIDVLVARPHLTALSWAFMAGTGVLQAAYFLFLQSGYRLGDLSLVYPIGRGTGALLAALAGIVLLGERPGAVAIAGIACIVAGIVAIGIPSRTGGGSAASATASTVASTASGASGAAAASGTSGASGATAASGTSGTAGAAEPASTAAVADVTAIAGTVTRAPSAIRATAFALLTGMFIATYTLWDKYAVSTLHTPPLLQGYAAFPVMFGVFALQAHSAGDRTAQVWRAYRPQILGAAVLAPLAYILVLIALSFTAVAAVAPAREVSVLFGVLLGRRLLGEGSLPRRLAAAAAIVAGIVAIAIG